MGKHCDDLLIGWGEIGDWLGVSTPTLKVWRDKLDMPVTSAPGPKGGQTPIATKTALSDWLKVAFDPAADFGRHAGQVL